MWFQTIRKISKKGDKDILLIPVRVLEVWECKKCFNVIFMKKYTYSPFSEQSDPVKDNWSLENVNLEITKCHEPKYQQTGIQSKKLYQTNEARIYCKVCKQSSLLAELKPQIDLNLLRFKYTLITCSQNIKKTKIILGKTNRNEICQRQSKILQDIHHLKNLDKLKEISKQINQFIAFWFYSKNFKVYRPFVEQSQKMRQNLLCLKRFIMKTRPKKNKQNEKQIHRYKNRQLSCSNNSSDLGM